MGKTPPQLYYSNTTFEANNNRQSEKQHYTAVERSLRNNTPQNETFSHNTGPTTSGMMNFYQTTSHIMDFLKNSSLISRILFKGI